MTVTISPTESEVLAALGNYLSAVLPSGTGVITGQVNRVPEPAGTNYVVMWPINRPRISTNLDSYIDTQFTASILGPVMTVTAVARGSIKVGATVFGVGVAAGTTISSQASGSPGQAGQYRITPSQTANSQVMASGELDIKQATEFIVQVDVHAAEITAAGDMAGTIATTWRDTYAVDFLAGQNPLISPLYSDDPRQVPFMNAEQQFETKWTIDLHLEVDQTVAGLPLQFFTTADLTTNSVEASFPS